MVMPKTLQLRLSEEAKVTVREMNTPLVKNCQSSFHRADITKKKMKQLRVN